MVLPRSDFELADTGGLIRIDGPTTIYLLSKSTNPTTGVVVSNIKYEIDNTTLSKFGNNIKDILDDFLQTTPSSLTTVETTRTKFVTSSEISSWGQNPLSTASLSALNINSKHEQILK